jgi:hypothetical protein
LQLIDHNSDLLKQDKKLLKCDNMLSNECSPTSKKAIDENLAINNT